MLHGEEIRARVKVLIEKALVAYERSLAIGKHAPSAGDWVARLEASIDRLRTRNLRQESRT